MHNMYLFIHAVLSYAVEKCSDVSIIWSHGNWAPPTSVSNYGWINLWLNNKLAILKSALNITLSVIVNNDNIYFELSIIAICI